MSWFSVLVLPLYSIIYYYVLYRYITPREGCRNRLFVCLTVSVFLQILIRFCQLADSGWIAEYNISKYLTIIMVVLLVFWGGSLVYGSWARVGVYLIATEIILSVFARLYWLIWGILTNASREDILLHEKTVLMDRPTFIHLLAYIGIALLLLIPSKRLKRVQIKPLLPAQILVILYLTYGCMPSTNRIGFDDGKIVSMFFGLLAFIFYLFFLFLAIWNNTEREKRHALVLKQYAYVQQAQVIRMQKQKLSRFRHDVRKHMDAVAYLLQKEPRLQNDPSFLQYCDELRQYENIFLSTVYCDSSAFNTSMAQIHQYCEEHEILLKISLKRLGFSGWAEDDEMLFGILLNHLLYLHDIRQVVSLEFAGDRMQGQNILRMSLKWRMDDAGLIDTGKNVEEEKVAMESCMEDVRQILARYQGMCSGETSETGAVFLFNWERG